MWIWRQRARAYRRLRDDVGLWYHRSYTISGLRDRTMRDAVERGERTIAMLGARGLVRAGDVRPAPIAALSELGRVHTMRLLESLNTPEIVGRAFGLDAPDTPVGEILDAQRRATGGTLEAARTVTSRPMKVAVNLGGGLHHAHRDQAAGFCLYNDVAIAIRDLRAKGYDEPVAVVDLDFHQGDGTESIFAEDPSVLTYSVHGATWETIDAIASLNVELPPGTRDRSYLEALANTLPDAIREHQPKLIFYLAGNDVLGGDALGDFDLTLNGVLERDKMVLDLANESDAKVVVTFAGGYSAAAANASMGLLRLVLTGYASADAYPTSDLQRHFDRIAHSIDPSDLQRDPDPFTITEEDILGDLIAPSGPRLIFDYYSEYGVELALERYGFLGALEQTGFSSIRLDGETNDSQRQKLRIFGCKGGSDHLLVELVAGRQRLREPAALGSIELLYVEWLMMQDPTKQFDAERPKLPGQTHPGLGLSSHIVELLRQTCIRLNLDGIGSRPANYHNAVVATRNFSFLDPEVEGRFRAIRRAVQRLPMRSATRLISRDELRDRDGEPVVWDPGVQILPVSDRLTDYFASEEYQRLATDSYARWFETIEAPESAYA
ncbi:MAG: histone deacetylase [Myxococcota bacterium]